MSSEHATHLAYFAYRSSLLKNNKKHCNTRARHKRVAPELHLRTHFSRISGATTLANAEGVSDRYLKPHGHWESDTVKNDYIDDSLEIKLHMTKKWRV